MVQGLHEEGQKLLLQRDDIEPITIMSANEDEILEAAKEVHGITVRTANISRKIIENSKNLQVVSRHGVGYDSIDVDALNDCGIPLAIAAHSNMISVAEHAMFMLLALLVCLIVFLSKLIQTLFDFYCVLFMFEVHIVI